MDYIGSKEKVNEWMFSHILKDIEPAKEIFLDACAGSGSVSKYAAKSGFGKIVSNDIMEFPSHIVKGAVSLPQSKMKQAHQLIQEMNTLPGIEGFFYRSYSKTSGKLFFSDDNAKKIDACRQFIESVSDTNVRSYLLYCLLEAFSGVSNCTGVHAAYLKQYKARALKEIMIKPQPSLHFGGVSKTFNLDILKLLISKSKFRQDIGETILYLDPPYNQRQYGPNYHLYETLVKYDSPTIAGKTGLRDWKNESKSSFCSKKVCASFTKAVVCATVAHTVFISYNSDGLLSKDEILDTLKDYKVELFTMPQKRYKSDSSDTRTYNETNLLEYLFKVSK